MSESYTTVPAARSENAFEDFKQPYTKNLAVAEANRCLYCNDAPCITACPTGIDIPEFIRKIGTGNVRGAARTIFSSNIFGMSCARVCPVEVLCVGDCVYNGLEAPPIQIGKLQRYATDAAFEAGWDFFQAGPDTGKSVGLVGGGPASLAAAHRLRRAGHACTIYEKRDVLGGLNTWGVAPYKMKADRAMQEIDWLLAIGGIEVRTGVTAGADISWSDLGEKHDALFVGAGIGADTWLEIPGHDLEGIEGAVAFIEKLKRGVVSLDGVRHALVVGGGNTAIDAVRELLGLGLRNVTMLYRRDESDMSGYAHEWEAAKKEGARAVWRCLPTSFEPAQNDGGGARVARVPCVRLDEHRRPLDGSEFELESELVLFAIGQEKRTRPPEGLEGVNVERGRIVVDEHGATGRPGVFAGGDCVNGGKEVVNAVAEGTTAAEAIDRYLRGERNA